MLSGDARRKRLSRARRVEIKAAAPQARKCNTKLRWSYARAADLGLMEHMARSKLAVVVKESHLPPRSQYTQAQYSTSRTVRVCR
eukprot:1473387-Rhodomonas_salina.2